MTDTTERDASPGTSAASDERTPGQGDRAADIADVTDALRGVSDPDLGGNVVDAGLVTDAEIADGTVTLDTELAGIQPETAEEIVEAMRRRVLSLPGIEQVRVADGTTADADTGTVGLSADRVVAVASAKGGVGKSTVAAALARGLSERGEEVGLFDADVYGPNVPDLVGTEGPVTATEGGHAAPVEAAGLEVMSIGLLDNDAPIAWRGAMAHEALLDLLGDTAWGDIDTLVVDLPPGTGDIALTTLQDVPVDGVVFVTTPYPTAVADTGRSVQLFRESGVPVLGAAVNMAGFTCPTCGDDHDLFGGDAAGDLDVPVLAEVPFDEEVQVPDPPLPDAVADLVAGVRDRLGEAGFEIPDNALDVSGLPAGIRLELVTEEFGALDPGERLHVLTDGDPESLLAAVEGGGCECGHGHGHDREGGTATAAGPVGDHGIQQVDVDTWALRLEKAAPPDQRKPRDVA